MRVILFFMSVGFFVVSVGCATSTPVKKAPIPTEDKQALKKKLVGTWGHYATADKKNSLGEKVKSTTITWTFNADGTGTFRQRVPSVGMNQSRSFKWHLEGRNLALSRPDREEPTYYRIDKWKDTESQMTWFNYAMSNYYVVRRQ